MSNGPHNESCTQAVKSWYDEIVDYNFNAARLFEDNWFRSDGKQIGHFTAVVWKGTTSMGCGRAVGPYKSKQGWTGTCKVIVCRCERVHQGGWGRLGGSRKGCLFEQAEVSRAPEWSAGGTPHPGSSFMRIPYCYTVLTWQYCCTLQRVCSCVA